MVIRLFSYLAALAIFIPLDMAWLAATASRFYRPALGDILLAHANMTPALVFYAAYPAGLMLFAIMPALRAGRMLGALRLGALFGLFAYGTYDLTNQATLRNWTSTLTLVDMAWGSTVSGLSAFAATWIVKRIVR